jgi:hypothetical protein
VIGGWVLGLGITVVFFFARYWFPAMSRFASGAGMMIGVLVVGNELVDKSMKAPMGALFLLCVGIAAIAGAAYLYVHRPKDIAAVVPGVNTTIAAPVPPVQTKPAERVPSKKTIRQLKEIYEGRTALQAAPFMADEINKWIETEGQILRVDDGMALLQNGPDHIECRFDSAWNVKLATFRNGELMRISGRINPIQNGAQIYLLDCEVRG